MRAMASGWRWLALTFLAVVVAGTALHGQEINWQEAVARLARESARVEICASVLKKYGNPTAIERGSISYGEAKAEYDAIIAGLIVALARKEQPASLSDLQASLQRGFDKREAFCQSAQSHIPQDKGEKSVVEEIVKDAIGPIIQAVQAIYSKAKDDDALTHKTMQTQLEATSRPAFASVSPSP
jgi:hypothetical protein